MCKELQLYRRSLYHGSEKNFVMKGYENDRLFRLYRLYREIENGSNPHGYQQLYMSSCKVYPLLNPPLKLRLFTLQLRF